MRPCDVTGAHAPGSQFTGSMAGRQKQRAPAIGSVTAAVSQSALHKYIMSCSGWRRTPNVGLGITPGEVISCSLTKTLLHVALLLLLTAPSNQKCNNLPRVQNKQKSYNIHIVFYHCQPLVVT